MKVKCVSKLICLVITFGAISGCASHMRNKQLEEVAKDWSYVIRASQVIPVYPLTEDLQPGDVLLVSTPLDEQQKLYKEKGFLPLDQLIKRINPTEYKEFYLKRYGIDDTTIPPATWQKQVSFQNHTTHQWEMAPHASFPSYNFEVNSGTGLSLALPVQGVPVALGLMKTGKAKGSITIGKSYTYGLDNTTLKTDVEKWAGDNRDLLRAYRPVDKDGVKKLHFLRIVSRIYAIGSVNVTINNDEAASGDLGAGADKTVVIPELKDKNSAQNYQDALKVFNDVMKDQLPGGKIKFATASSRSITLNEQFARPLVIGYVGFDMPILEGGRVGAPISTLAQLTDTPFLKTEVETSIFRLAALAQMYSALMQIPDVRTHEIKAKLDALGSYLPQTYPFTLYELTSPTEIIKNATIVSGAKVSKRDFAGVLDYLGYTQQTIDNLEFYLNSTPAVSKEKQQGLAMNLSAARESMRIMNLDLGKQSAIADAVDFVFMGY